MLKSESAVGGKERLAGLPQRYSLTRGEEDRGTLKGQRRPRKVEQNPSPL